MWPFKRKPKCSHKWNVVRIAHQGYYLRSAGTVPKEYWDDQKSSVTMRCKLCGYRKDMREDGHIDWDTARALYE